MRARGRHVGRLLRHELRRGRDDVRAFMMAFREAFPAGSVPLLVVGGPRFDEAPAGSAARVAGRFRPRPSPCSTR